MPKRAVGEKVREMLRSSAPDCLIIVGSLVGGAIVAGGAFAYLASFNRDTLFGPDGSVVENQGWRWVCIGLVSIVGGGALGMGVGAELVMRYFLEKRQGPAPAHYEFEAEWRKARRKPKPGNTERAGR